MLVKLLCLMGLHDWRPQRVAATVSTTESGIYSRHQIRRQCTECQKWEKKSHWMRWEKVG